MFLGLLERPTACLQLGVAQGFNAQYEEVENERWEKRKRKELEFNLSCALLVDKIIVDNVTVLGGG